MRPAPAVLWLLALWAATVQAQKCSSPGAYRCIRNGAASCTIHSSSSCNLRTCKPCSKPANARTNCSSSGGRSSAACSFECQPGFELQGRACRPCKAGSWRAGWGRSPCQRCPPGTTTLGRRAQSAKSCVQPPTGLEVASNARTAAANPSSSANQVAFLAEQLDYISIYTGKGGRGGGRGSGSGTGFAFCLFNCSAQDSDTDTSTQIAAAYLVASPAAYDARSSWLGKSLLTPVKQQGQCNTCVSHAIVAAGEAATASSLNISGAEVAQRFNFMPTFAHFCTPTSSIGARKCATGWDIWEALQDLDDSRSSPGSGFFVSGCATADDLQSLQADVDRLTSACARIPQDCRQPDPAPSFRQSSLAEGIWMIQQHIREHGAVVSRIAVTSQFVNFFNSNPTGVYRAQPGETFQGHHAVNLVGYNNTGMFWIARNTWSADWADGGYFRISYDSYSLSGVGLPDFTFGLELRNTGRALPDVRPDPAAAGCFLYDVPAVGSPLHLSQIADVFGLGLKLPALIQNNTLRSLFGFSDAAKQLPILNVPLNGQTVQLCYIDCPRGQEQLGNQCRVCAANMIKDVTGPGSCKLCPFGTTTRNSLDASDHDEASDCRPELPSGTKVTAQGFAAEKYTDGLTREKDGTRYAYRLLQTANAESSFNWMYVDIVANSDAGQEICQAAGGSLATIKTPEEEEILRQLMDITALPSNFAHGAAVPIRSIAFIGMSKDPDGRWLWWADGSNDVAGPPGAAGLVYDAWAPGTLNPDEAYYAYRVRGIAGINDQGSKLFVMDYVRGWSNYQIGALCKLPLPASGNEWPLPPGLFPSSERVPGGLPTFDPAITVSEDTTTYSFISREQDATRVSLVNSGGRPMTLLAAASLCATAVPGGKLFRWSYRTQLEELNQAANAISFRYLSEAAPITKMWLGLYQPNTADVRAQGPWRQRSWYFMPDSVAGLGLDYLARTDPGVQQYRVPAATLATETPFMSYAPNDINQTDTVASCTWLNVRSNIKRSAWLEDHPCGADNLDNVALPFTWAACITSPV